jgi:hypothetical protein
MAQMLITSTYITQLGKDIAGIIVKSHFGEGLISQAVEEKCCLLVILSIHGFLQCQRWKTIIGRVFPGLTVSEAQGKVIDTVAGEGTGAQMVVKVSR